MSDPSELTLKDLAAAIRRRKVSSVEATRALLARIDRWQPKLNAFARVEAEDALKAARAADRAIAAGRVKGSLHGVPLAHKDMYYVQGNLDPLVLLAGGAALDRAIDEILENFRQGPFIFNLGHGILPETPIAHVEQTLRRIRTR